jgi:hypothetical protein
VTSHKTGHPCNVEQFHVAVIMVPKKDSNAHGPTPVRHLVQINRHTYAAGKASLREEGKQQSVVACLLLTQRGCSTSSYIGSYGGVIDLQLSAKDV